MAEKFTGEGTIYLGECLNAKPDMLMKIGGRWFRSFTVLGPHRSLISALTSSIHDLCHLLLHFGLTLTDCTRDDLETTMIILRESFDHEKEFSEKYGRGQQSIDELRLMRDKALTKECPLELKELLDEMILVLEAYPSKKP